MAAPAQLSAWMCTMPDFDVKNYGDYPDYLERTRVMLAAINDHNISVNKVNGAGVTTTTPSLTEDTKNK